jgi:hypothetical protein
MNAMNERINEWMNEWMNEWLDAMNAMRECNNEGRSE